MFYSILSFITGAGVFLVGIVMFSNVLEKFASGGIRTLLNKISNNRFASFGVGFGVTVLVQSSTTTTVMVVGLVNAGLLTLFQATAISLGAHVGTTITGILVSLSTFKIKYFFMALAFIGAVTSLVTKKRKIRKVADLLISFGILFVGLEHMNQALSGNEVLEGFFVELFRRVHLPVLLILLAAGFTIIIQSSIALIAILLTMIGNGLIEFETAMFLVMGSSIGTTFTAIFASLAANSNARRAALINFTNVTFGVTLLTAVLWPLKGIFVPFFENLIPDPVWQLAIFNVLFNTTKASVLIWLIHPVTSLVCRIVKDKPKKKKEMQTMYIDDGLLKTPAIVIEPIKKEISDMARRARKIFNLAYEALLNQDTSHKKKIKKQEKWINFMSRAISLFIVKAAETEISEKDSQLLGSFHHAVDDLERIGDYSKKMLQDADRMKKYKYNFSYKPTAKGLAEMYELVSRMFDISLEIFKSGEKQFLQDLLDLYVKTTKQKQKLNGSHIRWLKTAEYNTIGGDYFNSAISKLEYIAGLLVNFVANDPTIDDARVNANIVDDDLTLVEKVVASAEKTQTQAEKSAIPAEKPSASAEKLLISVEKPAVPAEKPKKEAEKPATPAEKPVTPVEKQKKEAEKPEILTEKPAAPAEKPKKQKKES